MIKPHHTMAFWAGEKAYTLPDDSLVPGAVISFGTPLNPADEEKKPHPIRKVSWFEPEGLSSVLAVAKRPAYRLTGDPIGESAPWVKHAVLDRRERDVYLMLLGRVRAGDTCSFLVRPLSVPKLEFNELAALGPFVLEQVGPSLSVVLPGLSADARMRLVAMAAVCGVESLAYLAVRGRVHRDVTINNLMLGRIVDPADRVAVAAVDHVVLGDFGHASSRDGQVAGSTPDKDLPDQTLGTSFVQASSLLLTIGETEVEGYQRADLVTDLFALGVSLYAAVLDEDLPWTKNGRHLNWRQTSRDLQDVRNFATRVREGSVVLEPNANRLEELRSSPLGETLIGVINLLLDEPRLARNVADGNRIVGELAMSLEELRRQLPGLLASENRPPLRMSEALETSHDLAPVPAALGGDPLRLVGPAVLGAFLPEQPVRPPLSLLAARGTGRLARSGFAVAIGAVVVLLEGIGGQFVRRPAVAAWLVSLAVSITALVRLTDAYGALPGARWWWIAGGVLAGMVLGIAVLVQPGWSFSRPQLATVGLWAGCVGFIPGLVGIGWRELIRQRLLWWSPDIDSWRGSQIAVWALVSLALALALAPPRPTVTARSSAGGDAA